MQNNHPASGTPSLPTEAIATLTLYEINQDLLQGKIPAIITLKVGKTIVGRGSQSDIVLNAQRDGKFIISRKHAMIDVIPIDKGQYECILEDLGAINGTYVNGMRVSRYTIKSGDIIQFGGMCDVPEGYILEHSDVSVKYKFQFVPQKPTSNGKSKSKAKSLATPSGKEPQVNDRLIQDEKTPKIAQKRKSNDDKGEKIVIDEVSAITSLGPPSTADKSSGNRNKKAKTSSSEQGNPSELDRLFDRLNQPEHRRSGGSDAPIEIEDEEPRQREERKYHNVLSSKQQDSLVLDELKQLKEHHEKELQEMKIQFQLLQQSLARTEEHVVKVASAKPAIPSLERTKSEESGEKRSSTKSKKYSEEEDERRAKAQAEAEIALEATAAKITEVILKENSRLKEELQALRSHFVSMTSPNSVGKPETSTEPSQSGSSVPNKSQPGSKKKSKEALETAKQIKKNKKEDSKSAESGLSETPPPNYCQIDVVSLTSQLTCTLCQQLLLDAVVLRCSHGFCRLCIERHIQSATSTCPVCRDPPPEYLPPLSVPNKEKQRDRKKTGGDNTSLGSNSSASGNPNQRNVFLDFVNSSKVKRAKHPFYHRSDQLDGLVWMVLQTRSEEDRQAFRLREEEAWKELRDVFGIDSQSGYQHAEGANQELFSKRLVKSKGSHLLEAEEEEKITCDYCGGKDHEEEECPHKNHSTSQSQQTFEDRDEEDDDDDDEEEDI